MSETICNKCGRTYDRERSGNVCGYPEQSGKECQGAVIRLYPLNHDGKHFRRTLVEDHRGLMEKAFADQWKHENESGGCVAPQLNGLLGRVPSQSEATLAATVIQWLGAGIGQCFLREAELRYQKYKEKSDNDRSEYQRLHERFGEPAAK